MTTLLQDLRYAVRTLLRSPGFAAVVVLTLALGIGATTAIFSVLNAVVLNPLPYPESERLVNIGNRVPGVGAEDRWGVSPAGYLDFREHSRTLEDLGIYMTTPVNLTGGQEAERVQAALVTGELLGVMRARPALGRLITAEDDRPSTAAPGSVLPGPAAPVVVLSHDLWVRRFGGDPTIIGRNIDVDGQSVPVVGVLEPGMNLPDPGLDADLWIPMGLNPAATPTNWHTFSAVGRLAEGATLAGAQAELERLTERFPELYPSAYSPTFMRETGFAAELVPLRKHVIGDLDRVLWILLGAVGLVLLIACANVANLFLVRTEARRRELAVRTALGAARRNLARHFLAESTLLALLAGTGGLFLADAGIRLLLALAPSSFPRLSEVALGLGSVAFAAVVSLAAGLVFGILPLLRRGVDLAALRGGGRGMTASRRQHAVRGGLVVGQVALALTLLVAAGLMLRSVQRLGDVDPGLDATRVLTLQLSLPYARYGSYEEVNRFYRELSARVASLPGVASVGATQALPFRDFGGCSVVFTEDHPLQPGEEPPCLGTLQIAPGFFRTLGIPVRGHTPDWADMERRTGGVVVTRALAQRLWPGEDPIGKGIRGNSEGPPFYRVVGVTGELRAEGLDRAPTEAVFFPMVPLEGAPLWSPPNNMTLVVKTRTDQPQQLTAALRRTLAELDPQVPVANVQTMESVVAESMARSSFTMLLLGIAAGMALLLSAVGLYGVLAYTVGERRSEIGIRMALGARVEQVVGPVLRQSMRLALAGVVIGLIAALATTRVLRSLLFEVSPTDPLTLGVVPVVLLAVALLAAYLPARRAARVDPMVALRSE